MPEPAPREPLRNPTEQDVLAAIRTIARDELDVVREVLPEHELVRDLQLDSLQLTTLAVALEEYFGSKITADVATHVRTVAQLTALVVRLSRERT